MQKGTIFFTSEFSSDQQIEFKACKLDFEEKKQQQKKKLENIKINLEKNSVLSILSIWWENMEKIKISSVNVTCSLFHFRLSLPELWFDEKRILQIGS